jgi:hypothetical protein
MSRLSQIAKDEAERSEQEGEPDETPVPPQTDDDDEAEEAEQSEGDEAAQAPPAPPPPSPEQIEKRYKDAAKRAETYMNTVANILGPEVMATMTFSPLDTFPGLVEIGPNGEVEPSAKEATLALLNYEAPPAYKSNPETRTCQRCDGWGDVRSGAKRKGNELLKCSGCGGLGYTDAEGRAVVPTLGATPAPNGAPPPALSQLAHAPGDPRADELRKLGYTVLEPLDVHA